MYKITETHATLQVLQVSILQEEIWENKSVVIVPLYDGVVQHCAFFK